MHILQNRGFTLIELLVTIAIIGVLATIIFASVNDARDKGVDAVVKSNLKNLQEQMNIYYSDSNYSYTGACSNPQILGIFEAARSVVLGTTILGDIGDGECVDAHSAWATWVNLKSATSSAWCVDSTGESRQISRQDSSLTAYTVCP